MEFLTDDELPPKITPGETKIQRKWREFAEELKANPGLWVKWPTKRKIRPAYAYQRVSDINNKHSRIPKPFQEDGFEAVFRGGVVYVRAVK